MNNQKHVDHDHHNVNNCYLPGFEELDRFTIEQLVQSTNILTRKLDSMEQKYMLVCDTVKALTDVENTRTQQLHSVCQEYCQATGRFQFQK